MTSRVKQPSVLWSKFKDSDPQGLQAYFNSPFTKHLLEHLDRLSKNMEANSDYTCPSWAYEQADTNGRQAIINLIKDLLNYE